VEPRISYAARTIHYIADAPDRPSLTKIDEKLLAEPFRDLQLSKLTSLPQPSELELHVKRSSRPEQADASALIFGCSTTYGRFNDETSPRCMSGRGGLPMGMESSNGAELVLSLYEASQEDINQAAKRLSSMGISATVLSIQPHVGYARKICVTGGIVVMACLRNLSSDDDTFIRSMSNRQLKRYCSLRVLVAYNNSTSDTYLPGISNMGLMLKQSQRFPLRTVSWRPG